VNEDLVVAVTGQRALHDVAAARAGAAAARDAILSAFPQRRVVLLSALAEGADRVALEPWLPSASVTLVALLPLPRAAYETEFDTEHSREEFARLLGRAHEVRVVSQHGAREAAYAALATRIVSIADVIVAVWDGELPRGECGTGRLVEQARQRRLPLAWVRVGPAASRDIPVSLENFPR
jgi:hypothetical protein